MPSLKLFFALTGFCALLGSIGFFVPFNYLIPIGMPLYFSFVGLFGFMHYVLGVNFIQYCSEWQCLVDPIKFGFITTSFAAFTGFLSASLLWLKEKTKSFLKAITIIYLILLSLTLFTIFSWAIEMPGMQYFHPMTFLMPLPLTVAVTFVAVIALEVKRVIKFGKFTLPSC